MKSFDAFLAESAEYGTGVNLVFEAGMYSLSSDLENIVKALREAGVSFEIAGGVAVNAHILPLHRSRSFVTRYIAYYSIETTWNEPPRPLSRSDTGRRR
jgi:hypothetical protein